MDLKRGDGKNAGHIDHWEKSATGKEKNINSRQKLNLKISIHNSILKSLIWSTNFKLVSISLKIIKIYIFNI